MRALVFAVFTIVWSQLSWATERVALVIGNADYEHAGALRNPGNDARALSERLKNLDFEVIAAIDATHRDMRKAMRNFVDLLPGSKVALFFYAGHGLQMGGENHLVPTDAQLERELDVDFETIPLRRILRQMERGKRTNIVLLDACRDNPLAKKMARTMSTRSTRSLGQGLAKVEAAVGTMIAYATQPGNVAYDGNTKHSPFTAALLEHIETPGLDIAALMRRVRRDVIRDTSGEQLPWTHSSLTSSFSFIPKKLQDPVQVQRENRNKIDLAYWQTINLSTNPEAFRTYLRLYPEGLFVTAAKLRLDELQTKAKKNRKAEADRVSKLAALVREREALAAELAKQKKRESLQASLRAKRLKQLQVLAETRNERAEKLAKEREAAELLRSEREAELDALKAQVKKLAALQQAARPEPSTAPETPSVLRTDDVGGGENLVRAVQTELRRRKCYSGAIDGKWGSRSAAGVARYNAQAKTTWSSGQPSSALLSDMKDRGVGWRCKVLKTKTQQRASVRKTTAKSATRTSKAKQKASSKKRAASGLSKREACIKRRRARGASLRNDWRCG